MDALSIFLTGITGTLETFSYLVYKYLDILIRIFIQPFHLLTLSSIDATNNLGPMLQNLLHS
jgi:hypothetical protein